MKLGEKNEKVRLFGRWNFWRGAEYPVKNNKGIDRYPAWLSKPTVIIRYFMGLHIDVMSQYTALFISD